MAGSELDWIGGGQDRGSCGRPGENVCFFDMYSVTL